MRVIAYQIYPQVVITHVNVTEDSGSTSHRPTAAPTTVPSAAPPTTTSTASTTTTEQATPGTLAPPTTGGSSSGGCKAVGAWAGNVAMDGWCMANCNHVPPYCPPTHCTCS